MNFVRYVQRLHFIQYIPDLYDQSFKLFSMNAQFIKKGLRDILNPNHE